MCRHDLEGLGTAGGHHHLELVSEHVDEDIDVETLTTLRPYSPATQRFATSSTTRSVLYPHDVRRKYAMMSEGYLRDGYHAGILVKPIGAIAGVDDGTCEPPGGCS